MLENEKNEINKNIIVEEESKVRRATKKKIVKKPRRGNKK